LKTCLLAPLAKMLRCFAQSVFDAVLLRLGGRHSGDVNKLASGSLPGFTRDVPFSPLEEKVSTRVAAAQADNAKVDLAAWSSPQVTEEEAKVWVILSWFAVRWWAYNMGREALSWWNRNGRDPKDLAAIQDCIFQARASSYWHWHQGSWLFFWRFPPAFQEQMRDGTPFYYIAPCPVGHAHNMPSPSREAKIKC
jgi:hypothetical protein